MQALLFYYLVGGLLLTILALPLIRGKINPGGLAILPQSGKLADQDRWYRANAYVGRRMAAVGVCTALTALALFIWSGSMSVQDYILSVTAVLLGLLVWAVLTSYLFIKSL